MSESGPSETQDALVILSPLKESLRRPILEQSRLKSLGLSNNRLNPDSSQWKLPPKFGESFLKYPTPTSMAVISIEKDSNMSGQMFFGPKTSFSFPSSPSDASSASSSASENGDVKFAYSRVERQGRRVAVQYALTAARPSARQARREAPLDDMDIALVDVRGLPVKEGLRQALIARAGSLRRSYKVFDSKNTGQVSLSKFQQGLVRFGIDTVNLLGKDVKEVFNEFDDDNSGDLSLTELIGFFSDADEELQRITADGFLPGKLLWTGYVNEVNSQKTTLNRQPCWDPRRLKISRIESLLEEYKKQREFDRRTQELRRQLRESSDVGKAKVIEALSSAKHQTSTETTEGANSQPLLDTSLFEKVQKIGNILRQLAARRKDLRVLTSEAAEIMAIKPMPSESAIEQFGPFGVPMRDVYFLQSLFDIHKNKQTGLLPKESFKKFSKNITISEVIPVRQYMDWWSFMTKEKAATLNNVLAWYAHFIL